ncbi:hypothetical protein Y032_0608g608 [Ancylostoma ceylanicum]|uniref:Uncharacterized protein n=1 Tax=Ancylostoma ceylanicum TaxID=53326 RepID=A0A016WNI2_9BILA|nr:hypothetical protein Y032_0608g608 [Ancylostoma ceylanicum]
MTSFSDSNGKAQTPDGSNCLCGLTCSIVVERCRSCFGATCFMPVETSYAVTSFPPYQRPQLPRLSLSYDLVTPLPPMTIPLGVQYSMPQGVALPRPIAHSWPAPRPPLYIQVPASAMKTETNGRSEEEKVLRNADQKEKLHSAEAPPGPPSIPAPSTSLPASTGLYIPTTTVLSEEGDIDAAPIPIPSHSRPIKHEPELGLSFTPSLEDLETTSSATTTDPLDYPSERNSVDGNVSSVTTDNAIMSEYGQNAENLPDYLSNALDPTDATTTALSESTTISATAQRPGPLLVETAHIELYHPQGESFTESTESSTVTTAPTNAPSEIEITASQGDPPGYDGRRTENVPSDPLPPAVNTIKQHQILAPYSPPRTKPMNNEIFKVRFSGYETKNEEPYAAAPARNGSSGLLERSTVSYLGWKYNSKHRDSGITGKRVSFSCNGMK